MHDIRLSIKILNWVIINPSENSIVRKICIKNQYNENIYNGWKHFGK